MGKRRSTTAKMNKYDYNPEEGYFYGYVHKALGSRNFQVVVLVEGAGHQPRYVLMTCILRGFFGNRRSDRIESDMFVLVQPMGDPFRGCKKGEIQRKYNKTEIDQRRRKGTCAFNVYEGKVQTGLEMHIKDGDRDCGMDIGDENAQAPAAAVAAAAPAAGASATDAKAGAGAGSGEEEAISDINEFLDEL